jgi:hypothetical protein
MSTTLELNILDAFFDLMASQPTPQEILDYKISSMEERRLAELIELTKNNSLSPEDQVAVAYYLKVEQAVVLAKAKAYAKLNPKSDE